MKPKEKGDLALANAIRHYLCNGYEVCLPIGDKRDYDLIVEKNKLLYRVQVKYAGYYAAKQKCFAGLRITGGNKSYHYVKKYHDDAFDLLFVYTSTNRCFELPWKEVKVRSEISIENSKYKPYELQISQVSEAAKRT